MAEDIIFEEKLYVPQDEVQNLTERVQSLQEEFAVTISISTEEEPTKIIITGREGDVKFSKIKLLEKMYRSSKARHDCMFNSDIMHMVSNWTNSDRLELYDLHNCLATYVDENSGTFVKLSAWKQDDVTSTKNHFNSFSESSDETQTPEPRNLSIKREGALGQLLESSNEGPPSCKRNMNSPIASQAMNSGVLPNAWSGDGFPAGINPNQMYGNGHPSMNPNPYGYGHFGQFPNQQPHPHAMFPSPSGPGPSWNSNPFPFAPRFHGDLDSSVNQSAEDCTAKLSSYPKCMNVLILGETGVGKSTFINGLINYLKYNSLDEAISKGPEILIESDFTLFDDELKAYKKVVLKPTVGSSKNKNENFGHGQSSTQDPKEYVFNWGKGKKVKAIRIIDTPGIGDTRGIDQDRMNFDKILSFISQYDELHAICILIKPNTSRLTLAFRFCIDELLVHLHKSASENLLFCFTNTRGTFYKPGDTLPVLSEHLGKLEVQRSISIPLDISKLFSFDNESFRFLCASKNGSHFTDADKAIFAGSWTKSVQETYRLFDHIANMPVHKVAETLCLNNTRAMILAMTRPLAEIARNQMVNVRLIEDKLKEIEERVRQGDDLRGKLFVDQVKIVVEPLSSPRTVCTAGSCVEHTHFDPNSNLPMQTIYKTVCHEGCQVVGVEVEICPNTKLQACCALNKDISSCSVCKCPWSTHMHVKYHLNTENVKVQDEAVDRSIRNNDDMVDTINLFITKEREKIAQLEAEVNMITGYSAEFASFLAQNSIMPYNDSFKDYVEHLIREEGDKVAVGGPRTLLEKLQNYKADYAHQVTLLEKSIGNNNATVRTVEEIDQKLKEMSKLRHAGSVLVDVQNVDMLVRRKARDSGPRIRIGENWNFRPNPRQLMNFGNFSGYFPPYFWGFPNP